MAALVFEIMNRELFHLRADDTADNALGYILALGISAAPVLDRSGRAVGIASIRDLVAVRDASVAERMTRRVVTISSSASIEAAARVLADTGLHHLVAVDDATGRAVGMVSSVDVIRGLIGLPARHPATFPHYDEHTQLTWTDDLVLDERTVEEAPEEAGIIVLSHGAAGELERVVWAESSNHVRLRLIDMLSLPQTATPGLAQWLELGGLRFRASACSDVETRKRVVGDILERARHEWTRRRPGPDG